jgi:hypothetical protein
MLFRKPYFKSGPPPVRLISSVCVGLWSNVYTRKHCAERNEGGCAIDDKAIEFHNRDLATDSIED